MSDTIKVTVYIVGGKLIELYMASSDELTNWQASIPCLVEVTGIKIERIRPKKSPPPDML